MSLDNIFCNLVITNELFNNKPIYQCNYCGIKLILEDPETKVTCFKRKEDLYKTITEAHSQGNEKFDPLHIDPNTDPDQAIIDRIKQNAQAKSEQEKNNLCSPEQIEQRLSICKKCEYYQDNSCLLCGCVIVREANHQNKLAHKDQQCPANKWLPIV